MPTVTRTNLCTNPSFEVSLAGWSAAGNPAPTLTLTTLQEQSRAKAMLVTWAAGNVFLPGPLYVLATTANLQYTVSAYVYVPAGNPPVQLIAAVGGVFAGSAVSSLNDQWQRLTLTFTATAASHNITLCPSGTPTAGQFCYLDSVLAEQANAAAPYFDGASSGCQWTGTADLSTSQQLAGPLAITVSVDLLNEPPRYSIFVSGAPGTTAQVNRTDADGVIRPVRGGDPAPLTATQWIGFDPEAPYNAQPVFTVVPSDGSPSVFVTAPPLATTQSRFVHPGVPAMSMKINGTMRGDRDYPSGSAEHLVLGAKFPRIESDAARKSGKYPLYLHTTTEAENTALAAILAGCVPLLLQLVQPFTGASVWQYVSVDGVHEADVTQVFGDPKRVWTLDVTVVDRPSGGIAAQRTWADLLAESATWQDVMNKYVSWAGEITAVPGT
jgi:hypothetical protein